jgi:hypothetical protein
MLAIGGRRNDLVEVCESSARTVSDGNSFSIGSMAYFHFKVRVYLSYKLQTSLKRREFSSNVRQVGILRVDLNAFAIEQLLTFPD